MIVERVTCDLPPGEAADTWPFTLAPVRQLARGGMRFRSAVTFLVGENGSGTTWRSSTTGAATWTTRTPTCATWPPVPDNAPPAAAIDHQRRRELRALLHQACDRLSVQPDGPVTYGWRDRSAGQKVQAHPGRCWLRVVAEPPAWIDKAWWHGNQDADALHGISRPRVLDVIEWNQAEALKVRAELMTLASGHVCSATP